MERVGTERPVTLDGSDREGITLLREAVVSAAYDPEHMRVMLRAEGERLTPRPEDVPVLLRLLPQDDRLADLLRLFLISVDVEAEHPRRALAPLPLERALRLGLLRRDGDRVRSGVRLLPSSGFLFACDATLESDPDVPADHVMGVTTSSVFLASLTVRDRVRDVLDVGCGCGIQSVLAATHADRVVACDINPRALEYTRFNAALNGVRNVECRQGSFFEPVRGEKFDLVVSNPPFVISPDNVVAFRDSGMRGDGVSRMVVREAAAHLAEAGRAFVLVSWGMPAAARWEAPLEAWVRDLGCDAWLIHQASATPLGYAATWNEPLQRAPDPTAYERALDRWTASYRELGYAALGYGAVILRRRAAKTHWTRSDDANGQREPASGAQIGRLIAAEDYLASHDDVALLATVLAVEPAHRLDQTLRLRDGAFVVEAASLRLEEGLRLRTEIEAFGAELLTKLDGARTLEEAARAAAGRFAADGAPVEDFLAEAARLARHLLSRGFLRLNA